ncbi:MAG: hypothetical protein OXN84_10475 [Albidovulum sp.]|nr:hypothetical protein [Albidovulum sp.]
MTGFERYIDANDIGRVRLSDPVGAKQLPVVAATRNLNGFA